MPQSVTRKAVVVVRLVIDPLQLMKRCIVLQCCFRYGKQRSFMSSGMARLRGHSRHTGRARAAQQLQQQCFCLISCVVSEHDHVCHDLIQRGEACVSGGGLDAQSCVLIDADAINHQWHRERCACGFTMRRPRIGVHTQAVMNMVSAERPGASRQRAQRCQRMQQHHRIGAAGERNAHMRSRRPARCRPGDRNGYCGCVIATNVTRL